LRLWDAATGRELRRLTGHSKFVLAAAFDPDGRRLASASGNPLSVPPGAGEVNVWDLGREGPPLTFRPPVGMVAALAFSPDGRHLALAGTDRLVQVCDAASGEEVRTLRGHADRLTSAAYGPDGALLATGDSAGAILIRDAATGERLRTLPAHAGAVRGLAFSPDGRRLASASFDSLRATGEVKLWDADTGQELLALPGQLAVAFSADGRRLAAPAAGRLRDVQDILVWDGSPGPADRPEAAK
jgi:WD40 repeat protein